MYTCNVINVSFDYRKYFLILSFLCFYSAQSTAQFDMSDSRRTQDPCPSALEIRSADNTPMAQYVTVRQIFAPIAINYFFGEVNVRNRKGDTTSVTFDHPLSGQWSTVDLPVYSDASTSFANEIVTRPFILSSMDTLVYYREPQVQLRVNIEDETKRTLEQDTSEFSIPDSVSFAVYLIDASTHEKICTLDSVLFVPTNEFYKLNPSIHASHPIFDSPDFIEQRWIPDAAFGKNSRSVQLQLVPVYFPQRVGNFERRSLSASLSWRVRYTKYYTEKFRSLQEKFARTRDSLSASQHLRMESTPTISVTPVINRWSRTISIHSNQSDSSRIALSIYDASGQRMYFEDYGKRTIDGEISLPIPYIPHSSDMYFCIVQFDDAIYSQPIVLR